MTKDEVKQALEPLVEMLKTLEDQFSVDMGIIETEYAGHSLSAADGENYRLTGDSAVNNIIVDIRLAHDAKHRTRGQSPVRSDCLSPHRNTAL